MLLKSNSKFFDILENTIVIIESIEGITIHILRIDGKPSLKNGVRTVEELQKISTHPLKPFKLTANNSLLLFGTMENGSDFLSVLAKHGKRSFSLVLYTIISFLLFGMFMGIMDGYFNEINRSIYMKLIHRLIKGIQNMVESTPLLLWILLTIIFLESIFIYMNENKIQNLTLFNYL
jgi:ABC-type dipeptide/oligopeptide/nickel transport system permease subunit